MCGRFSLAIPPSSIEELYKVKVYDGYRPNYNVSPGQMVPVILQDNGKNELQAHKWGFIPSWTKDEKVGYKMINARAESVAEKPMFKPAFEKRRCLVLAGGFFEWKKEGDRKIPYHITLKDRELFGFAGIWSAWKSPEGRESRSCAIITTGPNSFMKDIHNRMPVILQRENENEWVDMNNTDSNNLAKLLRPYNASKMAASEVSTLVNNPRNNGPSIIKHNRSSY